MRIGARQVAIAAGALVGAGVALEVGRFALGHRTAITQGGSPWGGTINWYLARRGVIRWGAGEVLRGNLGEALTMMRAEKAVRMMENEVFYLGARQVGSKVHIGYDNGPDAFRHTGGSALIVHRLMERHGMSWQDARAMLVGSGNAHERDSFLHAHDPVHARLSGEMDVHNNEVGARTARRMFAAHAALGARELERMADAELAKLPQGLQDALRSTEYDLDAREQLLLIEVLKGIESGQSVTMTPVPGAPYHHPRHAPGGLKGIHQQPHPSSAGDIYVTVDGRREVRTMAPHAAGFPMPFRDGEYVEGADRVPMNLRQLLKPREDVPQQR